MAKQSDTSTTRPKTPAVGSRFSHAVFVTVGLAIVVGGLWLLYDLSAPYHPEIPVTEAAPYSSADS